DRVFLAGDAAGFVDPPTCEGISGAIRSGQLAARSLCEALLEAEPACRNYEIAVQAEILSEHRLGRVFSGLLYGHPRWTRWLFRHQGQRLCEAMTDVLTGKRTYRETLGRSLSPALFSPLSSGG